MVGKTLKRYAGYVHSAVSPDIETSTTGAARKWAPVLENFNRRRGNRNLERSETAAAMCFAETGVRFRRISE